MQHSQANQRAGHDHAEGTAGWWSGEGKSHHKKVPQQTVEASTHIDLTAAVPSTATQQPGIEYLAEQDISSSQS